MKKTIKIVAVAVAVMMVIAVFASCAVTSEVKEAVEEKTEEVKEAVSEAVEEKTEADESSDNSGAVDVVVDGNVVWTIDNPEKRYSEVDVPEELAELGFVSMYKDKEEQIDIGVRKVENTEGLNLEGYAIQVADEKHACFMDKEIGETQAFLVTFLVDGINDDNPRIIKSYIVENGDNFVCIDYAFSTCRAEIGNSKYSAWVPVVYNQKSDPNNGILLNLTYPDGSGVTTLADVNVYESKIDGFTYEDYLKIFKDKKLKDKISEDDFNDWAKDGWDYNDLIEYFNAAYGDQITDNYMVKNDNGVDSLLIGYNDDDQRIVCSFIIDGDTIEQFCSSGKLATWPCTGEAFAWSFHETPEEDDEFSEDAREIEAQQSEAD